VRPYRSRILISVAAVLVFTLTQWRSRWSSRYPSTTAWRWQARPVGDDLGDRAFAVIILINHAASYVQESVVARWRECAVRSAPRPCSATCS